MLSLPDTIRRLRDLSAPKFSEFAASSRLHAWLAVAESEVTGNPDWFSAGFSQWIGLTGSALQDFLGRYMDKSVEALAQTGPTPSVRMRPRGDGEPIAALELQAPRVIVDRLSIVPEDPFLLADFQGVEMLERESAPQVLDAFAGTARLALKRIADWHDDVAQDVRALVREVVPCRSPAPPSFPSGSCAVTPAAIYLSVTEETDAVAEMVIHETAHISLSLTDARTPIVEGICPKTAWDDARWYSPWRDQPRSLMGLLHAIHAFARALDYHRHRIMSHADAPAFNAARLATLHAQLRQTRRCNRVEPWLSEFGRTLLAESDALIERSSDLAGQLGRSGIGARFAERHRVWIPPECGAEPAVMAHHDWYTRSFPLGIA